MAEWDQSFSSFQEWVNKGSSWLTRHAEYQKDGRFFAICYDSKGRLCRIGGDFMRARDENAFPVRWIWPDQVAALKLQYDDVPDCKEVA